MKNKEVIDKIQAYLIGQSPELVARICASLMVDINRIYTLESLPFEEAENLFDRIERNAIQIQEFVKHGPTKDLRIIRMNSNED